MIVMNEGEVPAIGRKHWFVSILDENLPGDRNALLELQADDP
jgi:hypothetical protein